jgi:hypothetical protein
MFAILHTGADSSSRRVEVFAMNENYKSRELKPSESMLTATATLVYLFPHDSHGIGQIKHDLEYGH